MKARAGFFAVSVILLLAARAGTSGPVAAPALPGPAFDGGRYANLWTQSPFAIATPDAPAASADYQLVGLAQFDGISYASLIEKQSQEHFVLASDKPVKNLKLVSISRGPGGASAIILRNGEALTLRQEEAPVNVAPPGVPMAIPPGMPGLQPGMQPSLNPSVGGMSPAQFPPRARIHRAFNVPPRPISPPPPSH
jgi:hypothetical protein